MLTAYYNSKMEVVVSIHPGTDLFTFHDCGPDAIEFQSDLARKHKIGDVRLIDGAATFIDPDGKHHQIGRSILINHRGVPFPG